MEILSTGEKIKRARVYKGITLKELCQDRISISKMSCIENGKVKADEDILKYIAEKIEIDYNYLAKDVFEQINENLNNIKSNQYTGTELEQNIILNLSYAVDYKYYNLAFEFMHILINYYLSEENNEKIQMYISQYYDLYQKENSIENTITYFLDMADFLLLSKEYGEAIIYYDKLRKSVKFEEINKSIDHKCRIYYKESLCYVRMKSFDKAYDIMNDTIDVIDKIDDKNLVVRIYELYSVLSIRNNSDKVDKYISKAEQLLSSDAEELAFLKMKFGESFFAVGKSEIAVNEVKEAVKLFPKDKKKEYVTFLDKCIQILYDNKKYDEGYAITDDALNLSILLNDIKLIEKIYYYKGSILQKQNKFSEAEKYMNLSLDSLFKCGSKDERYRRYLEMGYLYYNLDDIKDSIKYFTLANKLKYDL